MSRTTCRRLAAVLLSAVFSTAGSGFLEAQIEVAGDLFVELNAAHASAGEPAWVNEAPDTIGDFIEVGDAIQEEVGCAQAVTFNATALQDAYQSEFSPPEGLVGPDPTRSIEVWAYNPQVASEETLVSWGRRGGPDGSNMSFNYGTHGNFGAVGHWGGGGPDLGWVDNDFTPGAPGAGTWHHLVYTYDGTTTRVYADGCKVDEFDCPQNSEELGPGAINTHPEPLITLAAQIQGDGFALNVGLRGTLSLARVRIHDGVLTPLQVQTNFDMEKAAFSCPCRCTSCPDSAEHRRDLPTYRSPPLSFTATPAPTDIVVTSPAGATLDAEGRVIYDIVDPQADLFTVTVECTNELGTVTVSWPVTLVGAVPCAAEIVWAEDGFVLLNASHETAGEPVWANLAPDTIGDFIEVGDAIKEVVGGVPAVTFNATDVQDVYQSEFSPPEGLVGPDATRSIEVWAFNPEIASEETLVSWGRRGGPDGSNMSFNYGTHGNFGAVGHWGGGGPDLGWVDNDFTAGAPAAGQWHHLVYTYDGATTRVYADGCKVDQTECPQNEEALGAGVIDTHDEPLITLASQLEGDGVSLNFGLRGTLSIALLRIHDGVLSADDVLCNFETDSERFRTPCECVNCPENEDTFFRGKPTYIRQLRFTASPAPTSIEVTSPAGAAITADGLLTFEIPDPAPNTFDVSVNCTNDDGTVTFGWQVTLVDPPVRGDIAVAGELLVELDAAHESAAGPSWLNSGTLADFGRIGEPVRTVIGLENSPALSFNEGMTSDAYQCYEIAPAGLVGLDPTRTIEVWAFNDIVDNEETLVAWGRRGGPAGTNMSFNYGANEAFGAVGHWGAPDLGWGDVPAPAAWHHLVYTYDGTTTRVYSDGRQLNEEELGPGAIDTHDGQPITLGAQIADVAGSLDFGPREATLALGQVRVHEEVLTPAQVLSNYLAECEKYGCDPDVQPIEDCTNGEDDDGDGMTDCQDDDCRAAKNCQGSRFVRGDADANGSINLTDGIVILNFLFLGSPAPACLDAADTDDDGLGNPSLTDAVIIFAWLFTGGEAPQPPSPMSPTYGAEECGSDSPAEDGMDCAASSPTCGA